MPAIKKAVIKTTKTSLEFDATGIISDIKASYDACPSQDKTLLKIPGANHNDIFMRGLEAYMKAVKILSEGIGI